MKTDFASPFIDSTLSVFKTMLGCTVTRKSVSVNDKFAPDHDITGIIGLSGKASGGVVISFEKQVALSATKAMLGETADEFTDDVVDAVGELTNMIAGQAKSSMEELEMKLALPTVIVGKDHAIRFPSRIKPISILFDSEWGRFDIEVGLVAST